MKNKIVTVALVIICIFSFWTQAVYVFGAGYQSDYLSEIHPNFPSKNMDLTNITYVGDTYYVSKGDGGLYKSFDAIDWQPIESMDSAHIVGSGKESSDILVVISGDTLYTSGDGANFIAIKQLTPYSVVHYIEGAYVAVLWESEATSHSAQGMMLISTDLKHWNEVGTQPIKFSHFQIRRHKGEYLISGIKTASDDIVSAVVCADGTSKVFDFESIRYDYSSKQYILKSNYPSLSLAMVYSLENEPRPMEFGDGGGYVDSFNEAVYYIEDAQRLDKTFYKTLTSKENIEQSDTMYFFEDSFEYTSGDVVEVWTKFVKKDGITNQSTLIRRLDNNGAKWQQSTVLGGYKIIRAGEVFVVAKEAYNHDTHQNSYIFGNMLSYDGITFQQVDEHAAYALSNMYAKRGGHIFADTDAVFRHVGNPADGIEKKGVEIKLNGSYVMSDQPPYVEDGRTFVPVRSITEIMGAYVGWDGDNQTAAISKDGRKIELVVDAKTAKITNADGTLSYVELDAAAKVIGNRVFVPVRFICEIFGLSADWDSYNMTVILTGK